MNSTVKNLLDAAMIHFAETGERNISVSELSRKAGVARGTIYNNFSDLGELFEVVTQSVADTINEDAEYLMSKRSEPHEKLACLLALFMRRSHNQPNWAKFITRFAPHAPELRFIWSNIPAREVIEGVKKGVFKLPADRVSYYVQMIAGTTYSFIFLVADGEKSWKEASGTLIEMMLIAGGVEESEAKRVANLPLPSRKAA